MELKGNAITIKAEATLNNSIKRYDARETFRLFGVFPKRGEKDRRFSRDIKLIETRGVLVNQYCLIFHAHGGSRRCSKNVMKFDRRYAALSPTTGLNIWRNKRANRPAWFNVEWRSMILMDVDNIRPWIILVDFKDAKTSPKNTCIVANMRIDLRKKSKRFRISDVIFFRIYWVAKKIFLVFFL